MTWPSRTAPQEVVPFLGGILGVFQKLAASRAQDHQAGGSLGTTPRPSLNPRKTETDRPSFARARMQALAPTMASRSVGYHEPVPRVCMSIHPEGKSCSNPGSSACSQ